MTNIQRVWRRSITEKIAKSGCETEVAKREYPARHDEYLRDESLQRRKDTLVVHLCTYFEASVNTQISAIIAFRTK